MALHILEASKSHQARLPSTAFVFPDDRSWPIHDKKHALLAIKRMKDRRGEDSDYSSIIHALKKRWGDDKKVMRKLKEYTGEGS